MYEIFVYLFPYLIFNTNLQGKEGTEYFNLEEEVGQCMWPGLIDREWWVHAINQAFCLPNLEFCPLGNHLGGGKSFVMKFNS